jgi:hypothetical protein
VCEGGLRRGVGEALLVCEGGLRHGVGEALLACEGGLRRGIGRALGASQSSATLTAVEQRACCALNDLQSAPRNSRHFKQSRKLAARSLTLTTTRGQGTHSSMRYTTSESTGLSTQMKMNPIGHSAGRLSCLSISTVTGLAPGVSEENPLAYGGSNSTPRNWLPVGGVVSY